MLSAIRSAQQEGECPRLLPPASTTSGPTSAGDRREAGVGRGSLAGIGKFGAGELTIAVVPFGFSLSDLYGSHDSYLLYR